MSCLFVSWALSYLVPSFPLLDIVCGAEGVSTAPQWSLHSPHTPLPGGLPWHCTCPDHWGNLWTVAMYSGAYNEPTTFREAMPNCVSSTVHFSHAIKPPPPLLFLPSSTLLLLLPSSVSPILYSPFPLLLLLLLFLILFLFPSPLPPPLFSPLPNPLT